MLDGAARHEIVQLASIQGWGVSERTIDNYIKNAREWIESFALPRRKKLLQEHIAARRRIRAKAIAQNNLGVALGAMMDEAKLLGLYDYEGNKRLERIEQALGISSDTDEEPTAEAS